MPDEPIIRPAPAQQAISEISEDGTISRSWFGQDPTFVVADANKSGWLTKGAHVLASPYTGLDVQWLADYVEYQVPLTTRTCRPGIYSVRPGCHISDISKLPDAGFSFSVQTSTCPDDKKGMTALEESLNTSLGNIDPKKTIFHLSAGLDSSLLVLLAARLHGPQNINAITFRALGRGGEDEHHIVERLCSELGIELTVIDLRQVDIWAAAERMMLSLQAPAGHPSAIVRFLLDETAIKLGFSAVVSGRGADEVLGGYGWHLPDMQGKEHLDRIRATDPELVKKLFPLWRGEADASYKNFFSSSYGLSRKLQYDLATVGADWQFIENQINRHLDIETIAPFSTPDAQLTAYSLPSSDKIRGGVQKYSLREHFSKVYPNYILTQPKRGLTFDIGHYLRLYDKKEILARMGEEWLADFGHGLNTSVLEEMIDATLEKKSNYGWQLWSLYLASLIDAPNPVVMENKE